MKAGLDVVLLIPFIIIQLGLGWWCFFLILDSQYILHNFSVSRWLKV